MIDLSIIIVSWNAKEFLSNCLQSLTHKISHHHSEIIVVDNASIDGSYELVQGQFPHVKLIRNNTNLGFAKANNIGIRESKGKYICLINSDVIVKENCIDNMYEYMDQHTEIGILGPKILSLDGLVQRSTMGFPTLWNSLCRAFALDSLFPRSKLFGGQLMTYWPHDTIRDVDVLNGCFWMVRREALKEVGLLDEEFFFCGEDIDWCKRFIDAGWGVVFFPDAEAIHYGGASSSNAPIRFFIEKQRANLQYWKKHYRPFTWMVYILICLLHQSIRILGQTSLYIIMPSKRKYIIYKIKRSVSCVQWLLNFPCLR